MQPKLMRVGEPGDSVSDPSGLRMNFLDTPSANGGRRLEMEWIVPPGARLVAAEHYHPDGPEVWTVLEGRAGYRLDGTAREHDAPHAFTVEAMTPHSHPWNAGPERMRVRQLIEAADPLPELIGGVQGFFETLFAFAQRGELTADGELRGRMQNLLTIHDLLLPGSWIAGPPEWVQRAGLGTIAAIARSIGRKPYHRPSFDDRGA